MGTFLGSLFVLHDYLLYAPFWIRWLAAQLTIAVLVYPVMKLWKVL